MKKEDEIEKLAEKAINDDPVKVGNWEFLFGKRMFKAGYTASTPSEQGSDGWIRLEDELLQVLENCQQYFDNAADVDFSNESFYPNKEGKLLMEVESAIKLLVSGWIDVKEKPEIDKWVLLYNGSWTGVGRYSPDPDYDPEEPIEDQSLHPSWHDETREWITPEPTHWRTLPTPPQSKE